VDKIRFRDLQRFNREALKQGCPLGVTCDSQSEFVLLTTEQYNKLVKKALHRHDSQSKSDIPTSGETFKREEKVALGNDSQPEVYDPRKHKAGDKVLIKKGTQLVEAEVPEVDAEGYVVWE
jgi:hypothetical protein